jgi:r1t holin
MTRAFWAAVAERAGKTFAQALLAALTIASEPLDILHTEWVGVVSLAGGAALLSVLTSLSGLGSNTPGKHADSSTSTAP